MVTYGIEGLIKRSLEGDRLAIGRLLTIVERNPEGAGKVIDMLPGDSDFHVIGVTGIAGSGKSTLLNQLITSYVSRGERVAVVAIDPSSRFSKGALLGDRIRMQVHATNKNVFIRSVSTRGLKGGLSFAGVAMVDVFGRLGFNRVFVESIGIGQADVDIMSISDTIVVVTVPGLGDDIQALKAGVMEIGDVYVINKVDKAGEEANRTYEYLRFAIESGELGLRGGWVPRIVKTSAVLGEGVDRLVEVIDEHRDFIVERGLKREKDLWRRRVMVRLLAEKMILDQLMKVEYKSGGDLYMDALKLIKNVVDRVFQRSIQ